MARYTARLVVATLVLWLVGISVAHAQNGQEPLVHWVEGKTATLHINVSKEHPTVLRFRSRLAWSGAVPWRDFELHAPGDGLIVLHPRIDKKGEWGKLHIATVDYNLLLVVHGVTDSKQANALIEIRHRSEEEAIEAMIDARLTAQQAEYEAKIAERDREIGQLNEHLAALRNEQAQKTTRLAIHGQQNEERRVLGEVLDGQHARIRVDMDEEQDPDRGVVIRGVAWEKFSTMHVLTYEIVNREPVAYHVANVRVFNEFKTRNHAGVAMIGRNRAHDDLLAVLRPGERIRAAVVVHDADQLGKHVTVMLSEPKEQRPVIREEIPVWDFTPPPDENEGKVSLHVQGVYGAIWLGNPDVQGKLDATDVKGLGLRVSYGLTRRWNFEAEALGAGTGQAEFDGGVARSAALGRVQFGGALRLAPDDTLIPIVRLGLGLQGANFDVSGSTTGEGDGFEFDALWYFGAGLDVRLGESFSAGVGLSYLEPRAQPGRSIELGAHLGYAWHP